MDNIIVPALIWMDKGLFMEMPERRDDFWLSLGKLTGWVRFSLFDKDFTGISPVLFEAVEVLPAHSPAPSPLVSIRHVLWRRQEAVLAERDISSLRAELDQSSTKIFKSNKAFINHL